MNVIKTIVLTAVVASLSTGVATAGVHALAQPDPSGAAPAARQAQKAQVRYTVTLTAKQLSRLAGMLGGRHSQSARTAHRDRTTARHQAQARVQNAVWHAPTQVTSGYTAAHSRSSGTSGTGTGGYHCPHGSGGTSNGTHSGCGDGHGACD